LSNYYYYVAESMQFWQFWIMGDRVLVLYLIMFKRVHLLNQNLNRFSLNQCVPYDWLTKEDLYCICFGDIMIRWTFKPIVSSLKAPTNCFPEQVDSCHQH
jgi:hypothetical protein